MTRNVWNQTDYCLHLDLGQYVMSLVQPNYAFQHVCSQASNIFQENVGLMMMHHDGTLWP